MGAENSLSSPRALPGTHWEHNVSGSHRNERPHSPAESLVKWDKATGLIAPEVQNLKAVGTIFVQTLLTTLYLWGKKHLYTIIVIQIVHDLCTERSFFFSFSHSFNLPQFTASGSS